MTEFLYKLHSPKGNNDFWPEQIDYPGKTLTFEKMVEEVEEHECTGYRLACAFRIDCRDREYSAVNITVFVEAVLGDRADARRAEQSKSYADGPAPDAMRASMAAE